MLTEEKVLRKKSLKSNRRQTVINYLQVSSPDESPGLFQNKLEFTL